MSYLRAFFPILIAAGVLGAGACADDNVPRLVNPSGADGGPEGTAPTARFKLGKGTPDFLDVPFPSDVYVSNGRISESIPGFENVVKGSPQFLTHELAKLNGFSRISMALFYVDDLTVPRDEDGNIVAAKIEAKSLPADEAACIADTSSVYLIDLEAADASKARVPCRALFHDKGPTSRTRETLGIGPARGVVLEEGHKYAAVLTSRVKDKQGRAIAASDDFKRAAAEKSGLYGAAYDKVMAAVGGALASDHAEVVALAPYTTMKMTDELFALRDALEDAPALTLSWSAQDVAPMVAAKFAAGATAPAGFTATLDAWLGKVDANAKLPDGSDDPDRELPVRAHDKLAAVGTAVFDATNYLQVKPNGYGDLDHATFAHDASGKVIPAPEQPRTKIWITFAVPTAPMPANGYPVVIVQHGLSSSRTYMMELANVFANKGWMTVAIDSVTFGARAAAAKYKVDAASTWAGAPGATYTGPDGFADESNGSFDLFGGLKNLGSLRDQLRQAELDTCQVVKLLRSNPDLSPLQTGATAPKVDPDRIAYIGESLGGIEGAAAAALEPYVKAWVLGVAGGGIFTELAAHSPTIGIQLGAAGGLNFAFAADRFDEAHPLLPLGQAIGELGDPIAYASRLVKNPRGVKGAPGKPRNALFTEVVFDELVSNESSEALARAAGYGLAVPNVGTNGGNIDPKNPASAIWRVLLPEVQPDGANGIHDAPVAGVTTVLVQISPAHHGAELTGSFGLRSYEIPYNRTDGSTPNHFGDDQRVKVRTSYREVQAMIVRYFDDAFQGKVPAVAGFKPPVRDADDDGTPDATDPAPMNPAVK
jgi:dienelactone hydrolase